MTQNHCFSKKYQPVVLKTTLEVCLKNISTFTEHYRLLEYRHHDSKHNITYTCTLTNKYVICRLQTLKTLFKVKVNIPL